MKRSSSEPLSTGSLTLTWTSEETEAKKKTLNQPVLVADKREQPHSCDSSVPPVTPECHPRNCPSLSRETEVQREGMSLKEVAEALSSGLSQLPQVRSSSPSPLGHGPPDHAFTDRCSPDPAKKQPSPSAGNAEPDRAQACDRSDMSPAEVGSVLLRGTAGPTGQWSRNCFYCC